MAAVGREVSLSKGAQTMRGRIKETAVRVDVPHISRRNGTTRRRSRHTRRRRRHAFRGEDGETTCKKARFSTQILTRASRSVKPHLARKVWRESAAFKSFVPKKIIPVSPLETVGSVTDT